MLGNLLIHASRSRLGRGSDDWELQMLYGIRPEMQRELRATGHRVRIYVPFGADWTPTS